MPRECCLCTDAPSVASGSYLLTLPVPARLDPLQFACCQERKEVTVNTVFILDHSYLSDRRPRLVKSGKLLMTNSSDAEPTSSWTLACRAADGRPPQQEGPRRGRFGTAAQPSLLLSVNKSLHHRGSNLPPPPSPVLCLWGSRDCQCCFRSPSFMLEHLDINAWV